MKGEGHQDLLFTFNTDRAGRGYPYKAILFQLWIGWGFNTVFCSLSSSGWEPAGAHIRSISVIALACVALHVASYMPAKLHRHSSTRYINVRRVHLLVDRLRLKRPWIVLQVVAVNVIEIVLILWV